MNVSHYRRFLVATLVALALSLCCPALAAAASQQATPAAGSAPPASSSTSTACGPSTLTLGFFQSKCGSTPSLLQKNLQKAVALTSKAADSIGNLFAYIIQYASVFVPVARIFLGLAFLFELVGLLYAFLIKGGTMEFIFSALRLLAFASVPLALFVTVGGHGFWPYAPNYLDHLFTVGLSNMLDKVVPANTFGAVPGTAVTGGGAGVAQVQVVVTNLMHSLSASIPHIAAGKATIGADFVEVFMVAVLFVPVVIFAMALMFALYGPLLLLDIGIVMGPLLIPWMVWKPLAKLASAWLTYMLTMGLAFLVGMLMGNVVIMAIGSILKHAFSSAGAAAQLSDVVLLLPIILVMLFMGYMLFKAEAIAAGLIGGPHIGSGGVLLAAAVGVSRMASGGGRGAAKGAAAGSAAGPAGAAAGGAAGAAEGAASGAGKAAAGGDTGPSLSNQARDVGGSAGASVSPSGGSSGQPGGGSAGAAGDPAGGSIGGRIAAGPSEAGANAAAPAHGGFRSHVASGFRRSAKAVGSVASGARRGYVTGRDGVRPSHGMHLIAKSTAIGAAVAVGGPVAGGAVAAYVLSRHARGAVHGALGGTKPVARAAGKAALSGARAGGRALRASTTLLKDPPTPRRPKNS